MTELFEKLICENDEEKTFEKHLLLKGKFLHKQIYDILLDCDNISVSYHELSSFIRYDKSLRNQLYIYLATFEECLRAEIFAKYDVDSQSVIFKELNGYIQLKKVIMPKTDLSNSNLYFCYALDLGFTIGIAKHLKMYDKKMFGNFYQIRLLRNRVMHHNMLIFGSAATVIEAKRNLEILQQQIQCLCDALPEDYKSGFVETINNRIGKRFLSRFYLEDIYV